MRKLIDLDTAIDAIIKESNTDGAYGYMDTKSIIDLLNDLPSAEPEIVRCKDCKYSDFAWLHDGQLYCRKHGGCSWYKDDYCSYTERRTDEQITE